VSWGSIVLALFTLAIAAIVFLVSWLNGPEAIKSFKRFERRYLERLNAALDAIFSRRDPKRFFYVHMGFLVIVFLFLTATVGALNGLLASVLVGMVPWLALARHRRRRREAMEEMLPDALISMGNSLRAGLTLPQSITILVENTDPPVNEEFGYLLKEHKLGLTLDEAMNNMSERVQSKNLDLVVTSIQVARGTGGNLPEVFEDTAHAIREITRLEAKIATMTAQGKMQAFVLGGLPIFIAGAIYQVDPTMIAPLWEDPYGWIILFFIAIMMIVGIFMIRKIVTVDV
jgi:tight adherence protein B